MRHCTFHKRLCAEEFGLCTPVACVHPQKNHKKIFDCVRDTTKPLGKFLSDPCTLSNGSIGVCARVDSSDKGMVCAIASSHVTLPTDLTYATNYEKSHGYSMFYIFMAIIIICALSYVGYFYHHKVRRLG